MGLRPLGVELKDNIKHQWWRSMVQSREDIVGLDSSVILPRQTWEASGHVDTFADPLTECQSCHRRFRADHLQEQYAENKAKKSGQSENPDEVDLASIACPNCGTRGAWTEPRQFSGLLKTYLGVIEDDTVCTTCVLSTHKGFLNFAKDVVTRRRASSHRSASPRSARASATRSPRATSSSAPIEQMEMEFFCAPGEDEEWHQYWIDERTRWYTDLGINPENLRHYEHPTEKLSHYSKRTVDIEYRFHFAGSEWGELEGVANRTDFDLSTHAKHSGQDLSYFDQAANERYVPYVIEPAAGLSRSLMTFLIDAYTEDEAPNTKGGVDKRTVLRLDPRLAPVKVAVLPLSRNEALTPKAKAIAAELRGAWSVDFDDSGAIGRRYRRQDEIGTPYCVTVDFDTVEDGELTVRERDTMAQERIPVQGLRTWFAERLVGC